MSQKTSIEWTDATWNPIRGCSRVSEGCRNCYAERVAARFSVTGVIHVESLGGYIPDGPFSGLAEMTPTGPRWTGEVRLIENHLNDPFRWKKPRRIFVNSMSDLFHEKVSVSWLHDIFCVMLTTPRHTYQILTKRPQRMFDFMSSRRAYAASNIWFGVSVENQATADERIPLLLQTPAAVRWVSYEPALGPVNLKQAVYKAERLPESEGMGLDWVVVGGESGPGARPCDLSWLRETVRQCREAGVPIFVKQLGAYPFKFSGDWEEWLRAVPPEYRDGTTHSFAENLLKDIKGGDLAEWPEDLRVREFPKIEKETT